MFGWLNLKSEDALSNVSCDPPTESVTQYENQLRELLDEVSLSERDGKRLAEEIEAAETREKQLMIQHEEQGIAN